MAKKKTDRLLEDMDVIDLVYFKYAPISSVGVESSLSTCKHILTTIANHSKRISKNI